MPRTANETIHSYVSDMHALENHIGKALNGQISDFQKSHPAVARALRDMHHTTERHALALEQLKDMHDAGSRLDIADFIKRAATTAAGAGAAAFDMVRTEKLPKNLRDDYTAFSLATIGYVMLFTTARALNEERVASLAESHLRDYTGMVKTLTDLIPATVVALLREDGNAVDESVLHGVEDVVNKAWQHESTTTV